MKPTLKPLIERLAELEYAYQKAPDGSREREELFQQYITMKHNYKAITGRDWLIDRTKHQEESGRANY